MDYYEELGIERTATEEEIRRAHRRLTKLLHPDQQTDEAVKQLAETQMRRVNSIVEVLCDPERRREYDRGPKDGFPVFQAGRARRGAFHSWPWWVGSTVGAVVLTVGAVWFWADKWGSSFGDRNPTYIASGAETSTEPNRAVGSTAAQQPAPQPSISNEVSPNATQKTPALPPPATPEALPAAPPSRKPEPSRTVATVPPSAIASRSSNRNTPTAQKKLQAQLAQLQKDQLQASKAKAIVAEIPRHKTLQLPLTAVAARPYPAELEIPAAPALATSGPGRVEAASIPAASLPPAPKLTEPVTSKNVSYTTSAPKPTSKGSDALEGEWVYAPSEPEKRKAGFYPPEFIDLKIWNQGGLRGEYRARYHVADKPIPPDVTFALAPDGNPRHFTWASGNGSKGTLKISSMDTSSIRIEWKTTVFSQGPALTAGTATLVRRTP